MKLLVPPRRLNRLARKEAKAVYVKVAKRTPGPRLVLWSSLALQKGISIRGRKLAWLKSRDGTLLARSPNAQHQTPASALRLKPLAKLTNTSNQKRRPLRRVLRLTKVQTLRSREGEGLQLYSLPLPQSHLPLDRWAHHHPGDELIPANAERAEWAGGLVLFQCTRHYPLIMYETELEAQRQAGQQLRLWRAELIDHECQSLDASRMVGTLLSHRPSNLPCLPPWAAPNRWDSWGRPWAYLDAPSVHSEVGVSSAHSTLYQGDRGSLDGLSR